MDRKTLIILGVAIVLLVGLSPIVDRIFPPKPIPADQWAKMTNHLSTNAMAGTNAQSPGAAQVGTTAPTPAQPSNITPIVAAGPEQTLSVTNDDLIFHFTSRGGGLKTIWLRHYPAVISRTSDTDVATNMSGLNVKAPTPIFTVFDSDTANDNEFQLSRRGNVVTMEKTMSNGLRLVKEITIGSNYLFTARVSYENPTGQPIKVPARELVLGTSTPIGPLDSPTSLGSFWYNGIKAQSVDQSFFANHVLGCAILPGHPVSIYDEGTNNVVWSAVHNQFFTLATIPSNAAPRVVVRQTYLPPPDLVGITNSTTAQLTNGFQVSYAYPAATVAPHHSLDNTYTLYAGPKDYKTLAQIGLNMNNNLDLIMNFSGPIGFFSKMLLLSLKGLHALGLGYGLAIIAITVIIKFIFWPLTRAATKSQKRMQVLQPQLKAIAEKFKDDPAKKNQKTMEFMKEHKVSPLGSCLPTLIQIPVFYGFYRMLGNAIELRGMHFLWVHDLSQPDTIFYLPFFGGFPINPLPLIMGATQLWQAKVLPPSPGMDPGQQRMMRYMPIMFIALLYRMSSGLTLYWTVQNLLSILQTKMTKINDDTAVVVAPRKKV